MVPIVLTNEGCSSQITTRKRTEDTTVRTFKLLLIDAHEIQVQVVTCRFSLIFWCQQSAHQLVDFFGWSYFPEQNGGKPVTRMHWKRKEFVVQKKEGERLSEIFLDFKTSCSKIFFSHCSLNERIRASAFDSRDCIIYACRRRPVPRYEYVIRHDVTVVAS